MICEEGKMKEVSSRIYTRAKVNWLHVKQQVQVTLKVNTHLDNLI